MSTTLSGNPHNGFAAARAASSLLARDVAQLDRFFLASTIGSPALQFAADDEIFAEGDAASFFYKIETGVVRICKFLQDGRRQIDAFHMAGEIFGFEAGETYEFCAEAVAPCTITRYRRGGLAKMMASDDAMAMNLFSYAMRCLQRSRAHALLLGRGSATQKIARFLGDMFEGKAGDAVVELAMTRQDIADYLGLTIETVSRTLSQLERDGVIALMTARRICLKKQNALRQLNA